MPSGARIQHGEQEVVPRISDIYAAMPAITGKLELEYEGEMKGADSVARELIRTAVAKTYDDYFNGANMNQIVQWFDLGGEIQLADSAAATDVRESLQGIQGLMEKITKLNVGPKDAAECKYRQQNSFWKASMRTSASDAAKSAFSLLGKNSQSALKNPSNQRNHA